MTVSKLIDEYYRHNPEGHFFDANTLSFFGEKISEMKVLNGRPDIKDFGGVVHENVYILSTYQRNHPCGARRAYHYFDAETFDTIIT